MITDFPIKLPFEKFYFYDSGHGLQIKAQTWNTLFAFWLNYRYTDSYSFSNHSCFSETLLSVSSVGTRFWIYDTNISYTIGDSKLHEHFYF